MMFSVILYFDAEITFQRDLVPLLLLLNVKDQPRFRTATSSKYYNIQPLYENVCPIYKQ